MLAIQRNLLVGRLSVKDAPNEAKLALFRLGVLAEGITARDLPDPKDEIPQIPDGSRERIRHAFARAGRLSEELTGLMLRGASEHGLKFGVLNTGGFIVFDLGRSAETKLLPAIERDANGDGRKRHLFSVGFQNSLGTILPVFFYHDALVVKFLENEYKLEYARILDQKDGELLITYIDPITNAARYV